MNEYEEGDGISRQQVERKRRVRITRAIVSLHGTLNFIEWKGLNAEWLISGACWCGGRNYKSVLEHPICRLRGNLDCDKISDLRTRARSRLECSPSPSPPLGVLCCSLLTIIISCYNYVCAYSYFK